MRTSSNRAARSGQVLTWLCGASLAVCLLMVVLLLVVLGINGLGYFLPRPLIQVELSDGSRYLGEIHGREAIPDGQGDPARDPRFRIRLKTANRDITGQGFRWIDEADIVQRSRPRTATVLERMEWGNFHGTMVALRRGEEILATEEEEVRRLFHAIHEKKRGLRERIDRLERGPIGDVNYEIEKLQRAKRAVEIEDLSKETMQERLRSIDATIDAREIAYRQLAQQLEILREELLVEILVMVTADGAEREITVGHVVRAYRPNDMGAVEKAWFYLGRIWEFMADEPRESNTEGGIFPAIFGTVMMVFLMVFIVTPFGVLASVYLREYARQGWFVRSIRIAVNNLAGVPSIVFGVFGLGFFVYLVGGTLDRIFYPENLPTPTFGTGGILWASLTLALLTVPVVIVATEEGLAAVPRIVREGSLALGATKFETTWKVVVPAAAPGILTGIILAMARAAGEVAPLMIVGMVKLAPSLPVDHHFPYVHLERKFMHLGFHIYDVGFQSPNVEATKPLVFATALLLVGIVVLMNLLAIAVRSRLRRKYASSAV